MLIADPGSLLGLNPPQARKVMLYLSVLLPAGSCRVHVNVHELQRVLGCSRQRFSLLMTRLEREAYLRRPLGVRLWKEVMVNPRVMHQPTLKGEALEQEWAAFLKRKRVQP